jgi:hypothetical protein
MEKKENGDCMIDLTKSYNRIYLWNIAKIKVKFTWRLFRLNLAKKILNIAFFISPDAKEAIEDKMRKFITKERT